MTGRFYGGLNSAATASTFGGVMKGLFMLGRVLAGVLAAAAAAGGPLPRIALVHSEVQKVLALDGQSDIISV